MKLGLYLMTSKGLAVLDALLADGRAEIAHVTSAPARGMNDDSHQEIAMRAKAAGVPAFEHAPPPEFRDSAEWTIAAGWRWMIDIEQLVILHDSMLPRYRGFSPMVTALINGEPEIGATAFIARDEPDTGPIVCQQSFPVRYPAHAADVIRELERIYRNLTVQIVDTLDRCKGQLPAWEQDERQATWSLFRDEADYRIDWSRSAARICRQVFAVGPPFPGAKTYLVHGEKAIGQDLTVVSASVVTDRRIEERVPGKVAYLDEGRPVIVCGEGLLRLERWSGATPGLSQKTRFA